VLLSVKLLGVKQKEPMILEAAKVYEYSIIQNLKHLPQSKVWKKQNSSWSILLKWRDRTKIVDVSLKTGRKGDWGNANAIPSQPPQIF
jgi:hypothetical protein